MQDELFLGSINFCFFIFLITCFCTNRHADNGIKGGLVSCKHDGVTHSVTIVSGTFTHFLTYMRQQLCSWNQRVEFTAAYDAQASDSCTHNCPPPPKKYYAVVTETAKRLSCARSTWRGSISTSWNSFSDAHVCSEARRQQTALLHLSFCVTASIHLSSDLPLLSGLFAVLLLFYLLAGRDEGLSLKTLKHSAGSGPLSLLYGVIWSKGRFWLRKHQ